jgi:hypothetical protein
LVTEPTAPERELAEALILAETLEMAEEAASVAERVPETDAETAPQ